MSDSVPAYPEVPDLFIFAYRIAALGQELLLKSRGDTIAQYSILHLLREPRTQTELAQVLHTDERGIRSSVNALWRAGFVETITGSIDASISTLQITPKGTAKYEEMRIVLQWHLGACFSEQGSDRPAFDNALRALSLMLGIQE